METILTTLHTLLASYPYSVELAVLGLLALGWALGYSHAEYTEAIQHPREGGLLIAQLCSLPAVVLGLGLIIDSVSFHDYTRLLHLGALLFGIMIVATICQSFGQRAARQILMTHGYERALLAIPPKRRGL
jgi:hypothetical protein